MTETNDDPRLPDLRDELIDPNTCEVMPGHQHAATDVDELADSLATLGQLNAVQVIEYPDGRRLVVAGRRRWTACKLRKMTLRADIWLCRANEDVITENLARAIRVAENTERCDPSAVDVAFQLRCIRNENGFSSAELASFIGMSESRVKRYLCVLKASDFLLETARSKALPIKTVAELMRCEKQLGERATRKYVKKAAEGTMTARDLKRLRDQVKASKSKPRDTSEVNFEKQLKKSGKAFLTLVAREPSLAALYASELVSRVEDIIGGVAIVSPSSPG